MPASKTVYQYTVDTLASLSEVELDTIWQHVVRGHLKIDRLDSIAAWLARWGKPHIRAEIGRGILPTVLGLGQHSEEVGAILGGNGLLGRVFQAEQKLRSVDSEKRRERRLKRKPSRRAADA